MSTRLRHLLLALPFTLALACGGIDDAGDAADEEEPVDTGTDAITSSVDCHLTKQAAYDHGNPFTIEVINIGGKAAAKPTGHAFLKMQKAADAAGVRLVINSGFRTMAEQKFLFACFQNKNCNNGNLAARPGFSNHQSGRALDLSTSSWLANNAARFGFRRTVPSEAWHYEFFGNDPGGPCSGGGAVEPPAPPPPNGPAPGGGNACTTDGQCNPGSDGSGLICTSNKCVAGCRNNAQCPGATTCVSGQCR
jgi:D-alanyl-D-alanine carboxypeptidase